MSVEIVPSDNGPYLVKGDFTLRDPAGNEFPKKNSVALCRCGQSANKPFCDGTHKRVGFKSEVRAR
ncbi:MAG TPA: CDGSH iron-sulfur domain-containing protein [Dehalococcoidia bacterium]|nr:CDGSH iron-sulfur domain-containing protein [Dehalococcoidia bacterium]